MHKRIAGIGAVVVSLAILGGCASPAENGTGGDDEIDLSLVYLKKSDPFFITIGCGAQDAADDAGVNLTIQGTNDYGAPMQIPVLDAVAALEPDALIVSPGDPVALYEPLKQKFFDTGAKVILVNSDLENTDIVTAQVKSDNELGGRKAAEAVVGLLDGGSGSVLAISNTPGNPTTQARTDGFENGLAGAPGITYVGVQYGQNTTTKIAAIVQAAVAQNDDLAGIFAADLTTAEAAAAALKQLGKSGSVKLVTFDAGPQQVEALENDTIQALVAQQPYQMGRNAVEQAIKAVKGEEVTPEIKSEFTVITKANLADAQDAIYRDQC